MLKLVLGSVVATRASAAFLARASDSHVLLTCDYNGSQVIDHSADQEPSAFFTTEDWEAVSVDPPDEQAPRTGYGTVDPNGKYIFDQRVRIIAFEKIWVVISKFFSSYFPDARWWLEGDALLSAIRTGTSSPWTTKEEVTVGSDSFNTLEVHQQLLKISRENSNGEVDRVKGDSCIDNSETCNLIRFPKDIDETGTVVLAIKVLPHEKEKTIGRFVDLQSGTFVTLSTLGLEQMTAVNSVCILDGINVNVPLDPVKYLKDSRFPDINYEANAGEVYFKTKRSEMSCSLWECSGDLEEYVAHPKGRPDPFAPTFAIPKERGLENAGWTPVARRSTGWNSESELVEGCENVTDQIASFTGASGDTQDDPTDLGRIHVRAQCRPHPDEDDDDDDEDS